MLKQKGDRCLNKDEALIRLLDKLGGNSSGKLKSKYEDESLLNFDHELKDVDKK